MIRESARLARCGVAVFGGMIVWCGMALAQIPPSAAPATQQSSSTVELEAELESALRSVPTMGATDVARTLQNLLHGDVSKVNAMVQMLAYNALAAAYEQLAQDARSDKLNPSAERNAEQYVNAATQSYIDAGKAAYKAGDMSSASIAFGKALGFRPGSEDALLGMARVYGATGRTLQAIERYQDYFRATKRGPLGTYEPALYIEIARVYIAGNLWNQAVKALNEAIRNGGDNDEVASLLSEAYLGLNKPEAALAQIQKAITKSPTQPLYYARYAQILMMQKEIAQALEKAVNGIEIARIRLRAQPDDVRLMEVMSQCYSIYEKVLATMLGNDPNDTKTRLALVTCIQQQSDLAQLMTLRRALSLLELAPEADRNNVEVLEKKLLIEKSVRDPDLRQTCERLLRLDPENKLAKETLATLGSAPANSAAPN